MTDARQQCAAILQMMREEDVIDGIMGMLACMQSSTTLTGILYASMGQWEFATVDCPTREGYVDVTDLVEDFARGVRVQPMIEAWRAFE